MLSRTHVNKYVVENVLNGIFTQFVTETQVDSIGIQYLYIGIVYNGEREIVLFIDKFLPNQICIHH